MVWVQLSLIPIVYLMMWAVEGKPYIWRWNLLSWVMLAGYLIGLLALPLSRSLDKSKNSVPLMSPTEAHRFINDLKRSMR
mgnify:CR=1 FL=1